MRIGGGKNKGSSFERIVCKRLSLWLTDGEASDLFERNVASGGRFTTSFKKGKAQGLPGDIMGTHPEAIRFLALFMVECKHHSDMRLDDYILRGKLSSLGKIYHKAETEAKNHKLQPMLIVKSDRKPILVIVGGKAATALAAAIYKERACNYHFLHRMQRVIVQFEEMLSFLEPSKFFLAMEKGE